MSTYKLVMKQTVREEYVIEADSFNEAMDELNMGIDPAFSKILNEELQTVTKNGMPVPNDTY
tara:strand:+ start:470 stop:655 length:186 start_codon:yes stop_codon:yes gene_type:complete